MARLSSRFAKPRRPISAAVALVKRIAGMMGKGEWRLQHLDEVPETRIGVVWYQMVVLLFWGDRIISVLLPESRAKPARASCSSA